MRFYLHVQTHFWFSIVSLLLTGIISLVAFIGKSSRTIFSIPDVLYYSILVLFVIELVILLFCKLYHYKNNNWIAASHWYKIFGIILTAFVFLYWIAEIPDLYNIEKYRYSKTPPEIVHYSSEIITAQLKYMMMVYQEEKKEGIKVKNHMKLSHYSKKNFDKDFAEIIKDFQSGRLIKELREDAERGDAEAQDELGLCYLLGFGVKQNHAEAVKCFWRAAEKNYASAQNNLGVCYLLGKGLNVNHAKAVESFKKAAQGGDIAAQCNMASCYHRGLGTEKDLSRAVALYQDAAEKKYPPAQYGLAHCYYFGDGVERDFTKAVNLYWQAAERGYPPAQHRFADCYRNGIELKRNPAEAVKWYRRAAEQGHAQAQYNLGECLEYGKGIEKNLIEAAGWYQKAAEQGHTKARKAFKRVQKNIKM